MGHPLLVGIRPVRVVERGSTKTGQRAASALPILRETRTGTGRYGSAGAKADLAANTPDSVETGRQVRLGLGEIACSSPRRGFGSIQRPQSESNHINMTESAVQLLLKSLCLLHLHAGDTRRPVRVLVCEQVEPLGFQIIPPPPRSEGATDEAASWATRTVYSCVRSDLVASFFFLKIVKTERAGRTRGGGLPWPHHRACVPACLPPPPPRRPVVLCWGWVARRRVTIHRSSVYYLARFVVV